MSDKLLYVTEKPHRAGVDIAVYGADGVPPYASNRQAPRKVYARRLDGSEGSTLAEIVGWYLVHAEYGSLPPDNTIRPPLPKDPQHGAAKVGHREKPWTVGDMTIEADPRMTTPRVRREKRTMPPLRSPAA